MHNIKDHTNNLHMKNFFGRFGNNIIEISSGIYIAKTHNSRFSHEKHDLIDDTTYDFTRIDDPVKKTNTFLSRVFYHVDNIPYIDRVHICQEYIRPRINWIVDNPLDDSVLVIHVRSGDLFDGYCTCPKTGRKIFCNLGLYPQPPFEYYKRVINDSGCTSVRIVTEPDMRNPVIQMIIDEYDRSDIEVNVQSKSFKDDANTILNAKNLVISVGTFSFALAMLSNNVKRLYVIKDYISPPRLACGMQSTPGLKMIWYNLHDYIPLCKWFLSHENVQRIKNHSSDKVSICVDEDCQSVLGDPSRVILSSPE